MANKLELKAECVRCGINANQLADALGISAVTLYAKMRGDSDFTRGEMATIRDTLHLSDEMFLKIFF